MNRFFVADANLKEPKIVITDAGEIHHLQNVLRLREGDPIQIFNDQGEEGVGRIEQIQKQRVAVGLHRRLKSPSKTQTAIILACAIPKKAKFELIIEKATELGVDAIIPLRTKRTEFRLSEQRVQAKAKRYRTVAVNAAKQCQRRTVPDIHPVTEFPQFLKSLGPKDAGLISCLNGKRQPLLKVLASIKKKKRILLLIGPEGDFTPQEVAAALKTGCRPVHLGSTVLKVDTAAITVVAAAALLRT